MSDSTPSDDADQHSDRDLPQGEPDLSESQLGEFLLLRRLGTGGMADVYLARQTSLDRLVAVKVLKPSAVSSSNGVLLKRFEQEARTAGGLNHPHIVQIITTGRESQQSYIVQEYVAGLNLAQWIRKHGSPDYSTGLKWMQQIAAALHAAHEAGIVHRDIKPENIMITRSNVAKVTDFGLAQLTAVSDQRMNLTQAGTTMGTPWYMSPEQIQGHKVDHRSDQYSFGVTCYHMFAGRPPFPGRNAVSVAVQHLKEQPPHLSTLRADLPLPLCDVIHRMMAKQPGDRFQQHGELEHALQKLERLPATTAFRPAHAWRKQLAALWPGVKFLLPLLLLVLVGSFLGARQLYPRIRLPEPAPEQPLPIESTAARQFAVALLNARNPNAWKAVIERFPESSEAEMAQMRLALHYATSPVPAYTSAVDEFEKLIIAGELPGKQHLKFIGRIGQAYVISLQVAQERARGKSDRDLEDLQKMADAMLSAAWYVYTGPNKDVENELALAQAPVELRDFLRSGNRSSSSFRD